MQGIGVIAAAAFLFLDYSRILDLIAEHGFTFLLHLHLPLVCSSVAIAALIVCGRYPAGFTHRVGKLLLFLTVWLFLAIPLSFWRRQSLETVTFTWCGQFMCLYAVLSGLASTHKTLRTFTNSIAAAVILAALLSLKFGSMVSGRLYFMQKGRFSNPNDLAQGLLIGLPFVWLGIRSSRSLAVRVLLAVGTLPILAAIVKSGSRGALVAIVVMGLVELYFATAGGKLAMILAVLVAVAGVAITAPGSVIKRYKTLFESQDSLGPDQTVFYAESSTENRRFLLEKSLLFTARRPILGGGPGTFRIMIADELGRMGVWGAHRESHNTYTQLSSEAGVPALIIYLAALILCMKITRNAYRRAKGKDPGLANLALCVLLSVVAFASAAMFNSLAYDSHFAVVASFAVAVHFIAIRRLGPERKPESAGLISLPAPRPALAGAGHVSNA